MTQIFLGFFAFMIVAQTIATKPTLEIGTAILGIMALIYLIRDRTFSILPKNTGLICGLLLGIIGISCIWGINADDAVHQLPRWILVFALCLPLLSFAQNAPLPTARIWIILVSAFTIACLLMTVSDLTNYYFQYMIKGDGFEPTDFNKPIGVLTMIAPALIAPYLIAQNRRDKIIALALVVLLAALVIPSYAQSALLSFMIIGLCYVMPMGSPIFWRLVRVTTIAGLLGLPFIMTPLYHHVADTLKQTDVMRQAASAERLEIWSAISERITESPIAGWGYNAARVLEMPIARVYFHDPIVAHPHNFVMQIWLETGAIGAVLACIIFTLLWHRIEQEANLSVRRLYFTSLSSTLGFALVGWNMWQTWWMITLFIIGFLTIFSARIIQNGGLKDHE
jgi:O-antigen ligase